MPGKGTVEFVSDDTVDQLLVGTSRLVGIRGSGGTGRQHAPGCTRHGRQVDDADGMNAGRP